MRADILLHRAPVATPVRTSFGTMSDRPSLLIRLEDAEGYTGWGEVWCNYPAVGADHRARLLQTVVLPLAGELGLWDDPQAMWAGLSAGLRILALQSGEAGPLAQCLAGLECALQDLAARRDSQPLFRRLSPQAVSAVPVYASGINPQGAAATAAAALAAGYTACKVKIGFDAQLDRDNLAGLRRLLGADRVLIADANQAWAVDQALDLAEAVGQAGLAWLEEPLRHDADDADWRRLAEALRVPLAAGENFTGLAEFTDLPGRRSLGVLQPDLGKWGGVGGALAAAESAQKADILFCPHWLGGGVGLLTSLHVKAATRRDGGYVEVDFNPNPLREHFVTQLCGGPVGGQLQLSDRPGLGVSDGLVADLAEFLCWKAELRL